MVQLGDKQVAGQGVRVGSVDRLANGQIVVVRDDESSNPDLSDRARGDRVSTEGRWIWEPSPGVIEHARAGAFMREQGIDGWHELGRRSRDDIGWFWDAVVRHLGIEFSTPYDAVYDDSRGAAWTTWFGGGRSTWPTTASTATPRRPPTSSR